ncbi:hypothetical protein LDENG_00267250 [Lucifuga dentata]|nr:hypothetical protein LDENG_00267250 [Lucifuga dentata]
MLCPAGAVAFAACRKEKEIDCEVWKADDRGKRGREESKHRLHAATDETLSEEQQLQHRHHFQEQILP